MYNLLRLLIVHFVTWFVFIFQVRDYLKTIDPNHPVFSVPEVTLATWKDCKLKQQQFNAEKSMTLLTAINYVLYKEEGFKRFYGHFYDFDNFHINTVRTLAFPEKIILVFRLRKCRTFS